MNKNNPVVELDIDEDTAVIMKVLKAYNLDFLPIGISKTTGIPNNYLQMEECVMRLILANPGEEYIEEIRAYRQEVIDNGGDFSGDSDLRKYEDISEWIKLCGDLESQVFARSMGYVEAEQFMLVYEGERRILGMINFRHYLNDYLAEYGGHIGYGIRPSQRQKGYGKVMLSLCLEKCCEFGLDKVLITCDVTNEGSRRTIIGNGGAFECQTKEGDEILERYWVPCGDIRIRNADIDNAEDLANIYSESWRAGYKDIIDHDKLWKITDVTVLTRHYTRVSTKAHYMAFYRGEPSGVISFNKSRDKDLPNAAEVITVYTLESVWGKGVGHAMMEFALGELRRQGFHQVFLWVFEANDRARKFYERHGFIADGTVKDSGFENAQEMRYIRVTLD
jgi:predicted acetyltransferase